MCLQFFRNIDVGIETRIESGITGIGKDTFLGQIPHGHSIQRSLVPPLDIDVIILILSHFVG